MNRIDGRMFDELRSVKITPGFAEFAEGSVLIECGHTKVLCCASVEDRVPPHVPMGEGWITAEYSMLPRANRERSRRDVSKLKLSPRSAEIQRLVGRSLRAAVDLKKLGEHTITIGRWRHPNGFRDRRLSGAGFGLPQTSGRGADCAGSDAGLCGRRVGGHCG